MAALIKYPCSGELHDIVVTEDGELIPLDHDLETEIAGASMGAKGPPCVELLRTWTEGDGEAIEEFMLTSGALKPADLLGFIIQAARHVLPLYERSMVGHTEPQQMLMIAEYIQCGGVPSDRMTENYGKIMERLMRFNKRADPRETQAARDASYAVREAGRAAWEFAMARERFGGPKTVDMIVAHGRSVLKHARRAVGWDYADRKKNRYGKYVTQELQSAAEEQERRWQVTMFKEDLLRTRPFEA